MVIIRLRNLNDKGPLGSPDRRKCHQHILTVNRKFYGPRLTGGYTADGLFIAAAELGKRTPRQNQRLVRMSRDNPFPVRHTGFSMPAQIDTADHIVQRVIFVNARHIQNGLPLFLHRHSHRNAQLLLEGGGGTGGQVICLLKQGKKTPLQTLRRAVDPLNEPALQVIEGDCMELIDLRGLRQDFHTACPDLFIIAPGCFFSAVIAGSRIHTRVSCDRHHPVCQHMDIGLHGFGGLPRHRLQAVQQDIICQRLQGKCHNHAAYDNQCQNIQYGIF